MTKEELIDRINDIELGGLRGLRRPEANSLRKIRETVRRIRQHFRRMDSAWSKQNGKKFEISGVDNAEKLEQDFLGTLHSQKFNEPVDAKSMLYHIDGHRVLAFHMPHHPTSLSTITIHKNTFIRFGSGDQRATNGEYNRHVS